MLAFTCDDLHITWYLLKKTVLKIFSMKYVVSNWYILTTKGFFPNLIKKCKRIYFHHDILGRNLMKNGSNHYAAVKKQVQLEELIYWLLIHLTLLCLSNRWEWKFVKNFCLLIKPSSQPTCWENNTCNPWRNRLTASGNHIHRQTFNLILSDAPLSCLSFRRGL